jgi:hypothetical protein
MDGGWVKLSRVAMTQQEAERSYFRSADNIGVAVPPAKLIEPNPSVAILALDFLLLIGMTLIARTAISPLSSDKLEEHSTLNQPWSVSLRNGDGHSGNVEKEGRVPSTGSEQLGRNVMDRSGCYA